MTLAVDVGVGLAAVSAIAAAASARSAARGVALSHRPYVYGEPQSATTGLAGVRLHNDGPGTAVEIRWRLHARGATPTEWSPMIRALQPGEIWPPRASEPLTVELPVGVDGHQFRWLAETEYSDLGGVRWRLRNDRSSPSAAAAPRRIRPRLNVRSRNGQ
jgi:hypothetical protein